MLALVSILLVLCGVLAPSRAAGAGRQVRATPTPAARKRVKEDPEQLLRVIMPVDQRTASAHPFVNVIVRFGTANGIAADPATFRVRLNRANVAQLFEPIVENGVVVGMRAALGAADLHRGRLFNRLRLEVRTQGTGRAVGAHDVDHVRFRVADVPDQAPVARALASSNIIVAGIPLQFDATQSHDPDLDALTYHWDFGDGITSADPRPSHTYAQSMSEATVHLTVSDGQLDGSDQITLLAVPLLDPGRTPGLLKLDAPEALEFGAVAIGTRVTRTLTVRNGDVTPTSQLKVRLGLCEHDWSAGTCTAGTQFTLGSEALSLGPGESMPVDLAFTPSVGGHRSAQITVVASSTNQSAVHVLSHGYGGVGPGTGPLPTADTLFFETAASAAPQGIRPSGTPFFVDNTVRSCVVPNNGPGTGDVCLTDADCALNQGTCPSTAMCVQGTRAGQPCMTSVDCPESTCPADLAFDPVDFDGDGAGDLYLLEDGTFTDPNANAPTPLAGTLLHLDFDANGTRTGADIITRTATNTSQVASDVLPATGGGQIYLAQYQALTLPARCVREAREQLVVLRKSDGVSSVLVPRIDAVEGLDTCNDDYDPADDLEVTPDGSAVFVALPGGVYRIWPTTLLMTPDVDATFVAHPDGSIVVLDSTDQGPNGLVLVYKISPAQAVNGAPHLSDLTPCATVAVPNNYNGSGPGRLTAYLSFAADPTVPGSTDATIVASFFSSGGGTTLPSSLQVKGTVAIASPSGTDTCSVIGLINLQALDRMTF